MSLSIVESLFKHSSITTSKLIDFGVLDHILLTCKRATDNPVTLRHAALALANLSLYSNAETKKKIIQKKVCSGAKYFYFFKFSCLIGFSCWLHNQMILLVIMPVWQFVHCQVRKKWKRPSSSPGHCHLLNLFWLVISPQLLPIMIISTVKEGQKNG